jgi:hypothetical protein
MGDITHVRLYVRISFYLRFTSETTEHIVAFRPTARQRLRNKQLYNGCY